jgi:hypothetical protein
MLKQVCSHSDIKATTLGTNLLIRLFPAALRVLQFRYNRQLALPSTGGLAPGLVPWARSTTLPTLLQNPTRGLQQLTLLPRLN